MTNGIGNWRDAGGMNHEATFTLGPIFFNLMQGEASCLGFVHPCFQYSCMNLILHAYQGADKSLARPGGKQATTTEDFEFHISYL